MQDQPRNRDTRGTAGRSDRRTIGRSDGGPVRRSVMRSGDGSDDSVPICQYFNLSNFMIPVLQICPLCLMSPYRPLTHPLIETSSVSDFPRNGNHLTSVNSYRWCATIGVRPLHRTVVHLPHLQADYQNAIALLEPLLGFQPCRERLLNRRAGGRHAQRARTLQHPAAAENWAAYQRALLV